MCHHCITKDQRGETVDLGTTVQIVSANNHFFKTELFANLHMRISLWHNKDKNKQEFNLIYNSSALFLINSKTNKLVG